MESILFLQEQQGPTPSHDERKMAGVLPPNFRLSSRSRKTPRDPYSSLLQLSDQTSDQTPPVSSPNSSFYFQSSPLLNNTLPRSFSLPPWKFPTVEQEEEEHNHINTSTTNTTTDQDWPGCISNNNHDNLQQKNKTYYEPADFGPVFEEDTGRTTKAASKKSNVPHQQQKSGDGPPPPKKSDKQTPKCNNNSNNLRRSYSNPGQGRSGRIPVACKGQECVGEDEKWAGPAYSKSPPPCSLPFPKFSVHQPATTRSLSADMTSSDCDSSSSSSVGGGGGGGARTAASSVTHQQSASQQVSSCNCWDTAFATKDLKRILNLDQQVAT